MTTISRAAIDFDTFQAMRICHAIHNVPQWVAREDAGAIASYTLAAAFGSHAALRPFQETRRGTDVVTLVGIGNARALRAALDLASPDAQAVIRDIRELPAIEVEEGRGFRFETRISPKAIDRSRDPNEKRSGDLYIKKLNRAKAEGLTPPTREQAYEEWLRDKLLGASVNGVRLSGFQYAGIARKQKPKGQPERWAGTKVPAATLRGLLTVTDVEAFSKVVTYGLGTQKAFGFGGVWLQEI